MNKPARVKWEYGDFQTPIALARQVCESLKAAGINPAAILEPTCGSGSLLLAAADTFSSAQRVIGCDVNSAYVRELAQQITSRTDAQRFDISVADFFHADWRSLLAALPDPLLVIGNPPWVTSSALGAVDSTNLPRKSNARGLSGLAALTGKSNFDICEWMLQHVVQWLDGRNATMAMLCKTAVARKLLVQSWNDRRHFSRAALYNFDAKQHFGAAVDACLFVCHFSPSQYARTAEQFDGLGLSAPRAQLAIAEGELIADWRAYVDSQHLLRQKRHKHYTWRSGVKHDCARVMELTPHGDSLVNGAGEHVEIEPDFVFPLLKGSAVARGETAPRRSMLVPQRRVGDSTTALAQIAPQTWRYLLDHADELDARRSSIYRKRPRFSVFGVGDYTFEPWKVAIAGLYKSLHFHVVGPHQGKPVVFDDTVYYLSCRTRDEAELLCRLLNCDESSRLFAAFVFWDAKRPITSELLNRLDLASLAAQQGLDNEFAQHCRPARATAESQLLF